jgi:hypothetical protein
MHTLERYLNEVDDAYLTDSFAVGLIKTVIASGKVVMQNPYDYEARAALMLASSFSHNGLTGMGETMYFTVHKLEHKLSGDFDSIAHGAGLSILYPAWAKYVNSNLPHRFATIARLVFDVKEENDEQAGLIGTQMFKDFFVSLGLPVSLSEVGVGCELFNKMALELTKNDSVLVPGFKKLHADDVEKIFYLAK